GRILWKAYRLWRSRLQQRNRYRRSAPVRQQLAGNIRAEAQRAILTFARFSRPERQLSRIRVDDLEPASAIAVLSRHQERTVYEFLEPKQRRCLPVAPRLRTPFAE